jgi:hypothetical protein
MYYRRSLGDRVNSSLMLVGVMVMIAGILVFGYQIFIWLLWGNWFPYRTREFWFNFYLPITTTGWDSVDKIISWISEFPLCVVTFLFGLGIFLTGVIAADRKLGPNL